MTLNKAFDKRLTKVENDYKEMESLILVIIKSLEELQRSRVDDLSEDQKIEIRQVTYMECV